MYTNIMYCKFTKYSRDRNMWSILPSISGLVTWSDCYLLCYSNRTTFSLIYMSTSEISLISTACSHVYCYNISINIHSNLLEMKHRYDQVLMHHILPADCQFFKVKFLVCFKWPISKIRGISSLCNQQSSTFSLPSLYSLLNPSSQNNQKTI